VAQWLTVRRAAYVTGVPRSMLRQRIRGGELPISDGLVSTEGLPRLYPRARLAHGGAGERVAQIRGRVR
jgi:hypothetical protein